MSSPPTPVLDEAALGVPVVVRDADTLVVVKPPGMAAETRAQDGGLLGLVRAAGWPQARLPHRLDRGTDGLQVVARDAPAVERHNAALRADRWSKRYVAVVEAGEDPAALLGTHRRYLRREGRTATVVHSGGKPAWQDHELVVPTPDDEHWVVVVRLRTGRYHQVRAVLADLGHPLVGDDRYRAVAAGRPPPQRSRSRPLLSHARLGGLDLDGEVVTIVLPSVVEDPASWPRSVAEHLLRTDLEDAA